jgi:hypothetical protein
LPNKLSMATQGKLSSTRGAARPSSADVALYFGSPVASNAKVEKRLDTSLGNINVLWVRRGRKADAWSMLLTSLKSWYFLQCCAILRQCWIRRLAMSSHFASAERNCSQ